MLEGTTFRIHQCLSRCLFERTPHEGAKEYTEENFRLGTFSVAAGRTRYLNLNIRRWSPKLYECTIFIALHCSQSPIF